MSTDTGEYVKPEDENAPVIMFGVWDDEAGLVTSPVPTREEADEDFTNLFLRWGRLRIPPVNTQVREMHIHDDGVTRMTEPADDCTTCPTPVASDFGRGDKVHQKGWGDLVFTVKGHLAGPGISRLIEIRSPGGISGAVRPDQLRKAS